MLIVLAAAAIGTADAASSPKTLRAAILRAELAQHSVHYVTTTYRAGATEAGVRARDVADVARNRGIQRWTLFTNGRNRGRITFIVAHSTAYARGSTAFALSWSGFPRRHAGTWFAIPHSSQIYPLVARNVTLGSFARDVVPDHHLSLVGDTSHGRKIRGLRGYAPEGGVLTIRLHASGPPLPVGGTEVERGTPVGLGQVVLSDWNEPVHVKPPAHVVPGH